MDYLHLAVSPVPLSDLPGAGAAILPASQALIGVWAALSTLHWLAAAPIFSPGGALPWSALASVRQPRLLGALRRRMSTPIFRGWMALQLALAAALIVAALFASATGAFAIACLAALLLSYGAHVGFNGDVGADGSDKIGLIAMAGTLLLALGARAGDPALTLAALLVAGGQLTICYFVAGACKLVMPEWRSGEEVAAVFGTQIWSVPLVRRMMRHAGLAFAAAWAVMLVETLFPLALLASPEWLLAALAAMLLFHILTAVIMNLGLFPFAFAAAYPSVWLLARFLHAFLGLDH